MSDKTMPSTGGCMCGAVRYEAIGKPLVVGHCHCHSCRRHTGAPVVTFVMFEVDKVRFRQGGLTSAAYARDRVGVQHRSVKAVKRVQGTEQGTAGIMH